MRREAVAFASGALFACGLCVSGMTHPSKILAFLDVTGAWDPSLMLVMVGAMGVFALSHRLILRRASPVLADRFQVPARDAPIDRKLVAGAALFGVGWGIAGLCPGPAVVSLASGQTGAFVFFAAMLGGMAVHRVMAPRSEAPAAASGADPRSAS